MIQIQNVIDWLIETFKITPKKTPAEQEREAAQAAAYADTSDLNVTAIIAGKLSHVACGESTISVTGDNPRAEYLERCIGRVTDKLDLIAARAMGIGGVILKPYNYGAEQYIDILDQSRFSVVEQRGEVITKAQFVMDVRNIGKSVYVRGEYHSLADDGTYTIENRATKDDSPIALAEVPEWANIPETITISGVEQMLFAFVKCPTDNRVDTDNFRGVPVTYGQDAIIKGIMDILHEIPDEYTLKRVFVGAESSMFNSAGHLPKSQLYQKFGMANGSNIGQGKAMWEVYSPDIRHESYFAGLDYYFGLLEKAIGVNKGILTDLDTADATATAIKRSTFDTFNLVDAMRRNLETALNQLAYAFDVYANAGNFAPQGEWELAFDWSYSLLEDSQESFNQLRQVVSDGGLPVEYETAYVLDVTPEEARELIPAVQDADNTTGE